MGTVIAETERWACGPLRWHCGQPLQSPRRRGPVLTTAPPGRASPLPGERLGRHSGLDPGRLDPRAPLQPCSQRRDGWTGCDRHCPSARGQPEPAPQSLLTPASPGRGSRLRAVSAAHLQEAAALTLLGNTTSPTPASPKPGSPFPVLGGVAFHGRTCLSCPTRLSPPRKSGPCLSVPC